MSPQTGHSSDTLQSQRHQKQTSTVTVNPGYQAPTTFFLRREREISQDSEDILLQPEQETSSSGPGQYTLKEDMVNSSYGVQSLADTLEDAFSTRSRDVSPSTASSFSQDTRSEASVQQSPRSDMIGSKKRKAGNPIHPKILATAQRIISGDQSPARSPPRPHHAPTASSSSVSAQARKGSDTSLNQPFSPLQLSSRPDSGLAGTPRSASVRSLRLSDEEGSVIDDTGSQAVQSSSGEEDYDDELRDHTSAVAGAEEPTNGPQLVMPSIAMPSRRPFTERGKRMGKLKIMVASREGLGRTSLIKSIVQACEDIVHVDLPVSLRIQPESMGHLHRDRSSTNETVTQARENKRGITEVYGSTKPYPSWWSDVDDGKMLRRRKSTGDMVLERNLCFIDTFGWRSDDLAELTCPHSSYREVARLPEILMKQNAALGDLSDSELLSLFTTGGGVQVDTVLYLLADVPHDHEIELLRQWSTWTNIVPVIARSDAYSEEELRYLMTQIRSKLDDAGISAFCFNNGQHSGKATAHFDSPGSNPIYAVSSALGDDDEVMDASILMSSEYVRPLVPSDISRMVQDLFEPENMLWLRHSAVKKFVQWRRRQLANSLDLQAQADLTSSLDTAVLLHNPHDPSMSSASTVSTHSGVLIPYPHSTSASSLSPSSESEGSHAYRHIHLAEWAQDLQRGMDLERLSRHQHHTRAEPQPTSRTAIVTRNHHHKQASRSPHFDPTDPLGLLDIRRNWPRAIRILGLGSLLGTTIFVIVRNWSQISISLFSVLRSLGLEPYIPWTIPHSQSPNSSFGANVNAGPATASSLTDIGGLAHFTGRIREGFTIWRHSVSEALTSSVAIGAGQRNVVVGEGFPGRGGDWAFSDLFTASAPSAPSSSPSSFATSGFADRVDLDALAARGFKAVGPPIWDAGTEIGALGYDGNRLFRGKHGSWVEGLRSYGVGGRWLRNFGWGDWGLGEGWGLMRT